MLLFLSGPRKLALGGESALEVPGAFPSPRPGHRISSRGLGAVGARVGVAWGSLDFLWKVSCCLVRLCRFQKPVGLMGTKSLEAGLWGKGSVVSSLGVWDPQVGRGTAGGWTCSWTQSCFLFAQARRLPDASPLLPLEPLEGPSPPGIYGAVGCLIICGGCSSSAL